jgi:hypothetical protein
MTAPARTITWQEFQQARQLFSAPPAAVPPVTISPPAAPLAPQATFIYPRWPSIPTPMSFDAYGGYADDQPGFGDQNQQPQPQPSPIPSWLSSTFRDRAWQPPVWVWEHQRAAAEEQVARDLQREVDEQLNRSLQQSMGEEEEGSRE